MTYLFPLPDWENKVGVDQQTLDQLGNTLDQMVQGYIVWGTSENANYLAYLMLKELEANGYQLVKL